VATGAKVCNAELNEKGKKVIRAQGDTKESALFGQHLFPSEGKRLIITEGEIDAMSVYYMLNKRYPVISVVNGVGTASKDIARNIDYIQGFDEVILCFDNDKPGQDKAKEIAKTLTPGKAQMVPLVKYKDANDYLRHGDFKDFVSAFWDKKRVQPDGIVNLADIFQEMLNQSDQPCIPYPWAGLNAMLDGIRDAELVTITSGSGMGKSSVMRELEHHLLTTTTDMIGILALEETPVRTAEGIMGIECNTQLHRKKYREEVSPEDYKAAFDKTMGTGRLVAYDHFGSTSGDNLIAQINYMVKALGCKRVILDHLSIVVSSQEDGGDERKNIDRIMTNLRSLVQETGISMFLVSHLRRVGGDKGHENGAEVTLSHLRGSQSIAQLSDAVISLERDQQAATVKEANLTKVRVLKSRYTGQTGIATHLWFDPDTGRLVEIGGDEEVAVFLADGAEDFDF
jgi:twinkle protein